MVSTANRIFGLPLQYLDTVDMGGRAYRNSILADTPFLYVLPGKLKFRGQLSRSFTSFWNKFTFDFVPGAMDERGITFKESYFEYKEYFITLANFVYINMMGFDYGRELEVPPGHELLSGDVLPGGVDPDHNRKIFEDYIQSIKEDPIYQHSGRDPNEIVKEEEAKATKEALALEAGEKGEAQKKEKDGYNQKYNDQTPINKQSNANASREDARRLNKERFTHGLTYYMEASSSVSEDISGSYGESELASEMKQLSSQAQARKYSETFKWGGGVAETLMSWKDKLGSLIARNDISTTSSLIKGANIVLPEMWQGSEYGRSYSISFKFTSPYGDNQSIFEYVLLPLISLICLCLPKQITPNTHLAPFIVMADSPGNFFTEMGVITSMSFRKGGDQNSWNKYGLPLSMDVTISLKDLTPVLMISRSTNEMFKSGGMAAWAANLSGLALEASTGSIGWRVLSRYLAGRTNIMKFLRQDGEWRFNLKKFVDIRTNIFLKKN